MALSSVQKLSGVWLLLAALLDGVGAFDAAGALLDTVGVFDAAGALLDTVGAFDAAGALLDAVGAFDAAGALLDAVGSFDAVAVLLDAAGAFDVAGALPDDGVCAGAEATDEVCTPTDPSSAGDIDGILLDEKAGGCDTVVTVSEWLSGENELAGKILEASATPAFSGKARGPVPGPAQATSEIISANRMDNKQTRFMIVPLFFHVLFRPSFSSIRNRF